MKSNDRKREHYCCLYHFSEGKKQKSSAPCCNHVPLGVITPLRANFPRRPNSPPTNIQINSQAHRPQPHTHFYNEIQNKQSLPKRLAYPRIYVEQINSRSSNVDCNLIAGSTALLKNESFQKIYSLFKKYAQKSGHKSYEDTMKAIKKFSQQYDIYPTSNLNVEKSKQYFFTENDFRNYLTSLSLDEQDIRQFWKVAFNQQRFAVVGNKKVIQMRAFAYNFRKFYLDEVQSFKNCLSEAALRQRMVDLRLYLQPWFTKNIIFKENHKNWRQIQFEICAQLRRYGEQKFYRDVMNDIETRNYIWLVMRILAKLFYQQTDQKNVGLELFNQRVTEFVQYLHQNLQFFSQFLNAFETNLITINKSKSERFKVTQLIEFAKQKKLDKDNKLVLCLRGLFKYFYFYKKSPQLTLNYQTLNLDCSCILEVNYNQVLEYKKFKQNQAQRSIDLIKKICNEINETVQNRPNINGHKKFLNQCNYLYQCLLKIVRRCDFDVFSRLDKIRKLYLSGNISNLNELAIILVDHSKNHQFPSQFWKQIFIFEMFQDKIQQSTQSKPHQKNYVLALNEFDQMLEKNKKIIQQNANIDQIQVIKNDQNKNYKKNQSQKNELKKNENKNNNSTSQEKKIELKHEHHLSSSYCSLCGTMCTSLSEQINKIDQMSSYLFELLNGI